MWEFAKKQKVLEINPRSPLIEGLLRRIEQLPAEEEERDIEAEEGGAGVYNINLKSMFVYYSGNGRTNVWDSVENYLLADDEWKNDIIPEIMDGKNIADFIDPDILEKLDALEREEEKLEAEGFYASDSDMVCAAICSAPPAGTLTHRDHLSTIPKTSARLSKLNPHARRNSSRRARRRR